MGKQCKKLANKYTKSVQNIAKKNIIVGYGAAAKANTFLNYTKIHFDAIIDDNKLKQNKFCPGSKIPIKPLTYLKKYKKDVFVVPLAWNFYKEIKKKVLRSRKKNNDKFLVFYPKFKIY